MEDKQNRSKEIKEFLLKINKLCWEYHIEIKPTYPIPIDEHATISIVNGSEIIKLLYIDGDENI